MSDSTKYEQSAEEGEREPVRVNPKPGDVLAGKYRIGRILGEGGMGIVVQATHLQLRQPVALKFMLPKALSNKEAIARFEREARAAVRLKSPHVAKVTDTGTLENGAPYMVMEYLEGRTLSSVVRASDGGLAVEEAVDYLLQACEGVAEAHSLGIVHRDLKPSNLFLTSAADGSPTIKVLDFGVSKLGPLGTTADDGTVEGEVTKTEAVVGSPLYMSPEQMKSSREVDARSDVWSLGVCLFEMVTGKVPFVADSIHQQYTLLMVEEPPRPSSRRPELPTELDDVVLRCLARDRDARFQDVGELAAALAPLGPPSAAAAVARIERTLAADRSGKSGPYPRSPSVPPRGGASSDRTSKPKLPPAKTDVTWGGTTAGAAPTKSSRTSILIAAIATAVAIGLAALLYFGRSEPASPSGTSRASASTPTSIATAPTESASPTPSASSAAAPSAISAPTATATATARPTAHPTRPVVTAKPSGDTVDLTNRK